MKDNFINLWRATIGLPLAGLKWLLAFINAFSLNWGTDTINRWIARLESWTYNK